MAARRAIRASSAASAISRPAASRSSSIRSCSGPARAFPGAGGSRSPHDLSSGDQRCQRLPRRRDDRRDFTRDTRQSDGRLFGGPLRLDLSPDDPALRQSLRHRGRRRPVRDRLGAPRPRDDPRAGLDKGRDDRRLGQCGLGLSVRRRAQRARQRRALDVRRRRLTKKPVDAPRTSSPIRPTGRAGWAGSTRAKTASGRISISLRANPNIDFVSFDNYLPLTDWTTATNGGLDGDGMADAAPFRRLAAAVRVAERPRSHRRRRRSIRRPISRPTSRAASISTGSTTTAAPAQ